MDETGKCIIPDHIGHICFAWKLWLEGQRGSGVELGCLSMRYSQLWQLWMKGDIRGVSGADSSIKIGDDFHGTHSKGTTEQHCPWLGGMAEHRTSKVTCHNYKIYKMGFMPPLTKLIQQS